MQSQFLEESILSVKNVESNAHRSILCIDPSPGMLLIYRALLEANGYFVLTASSAQAGLELLKQNRIDAVVMDSEFQETSAIKLAREIKNICKELPLVVFSSSSHPEGDYAEIGFVLDKARGPKALLHVIDKICKS